MEYKKDLLPSGNIHSREISKYSWPRILTLKNKILY